MENKIKTEKRKMRAYVRAAHPSFDGLCDKFFSLCQVQKASTILLFYGMEGEPDTVPLIKRLLECGKNIALPVCLPGHNMEARIIRSLEDTELGSYGIPEPNSLCPVVPPEDIEVALVPNICCDKNNYRLGHGGGYYDRYLIGFKGLTVCLCPKEILADKVPVDEFDIPVDIVIV